MRGVGFGSLVEGHLGQTLGPTLTFSLTFPQVPSSCPSQGHTSTSPSRLDTWENWTDT